MFSPSNLAILQCDAPKSCLLLNLIPSNSSYYSSHMFFTAINTTVTLWQTNIAMENDPFIDGLPIKKSDFPWRTVK